MTDKEIANWVRNWFKQHPDCKELNSMYEDFIGITPTYKCIGKLTELIWKIDPLKYMSYIPKYMFFDCENITNIIIPNSIKCVKDAGFYGCKSLTSVTLCDSITSISNSMFQSCDNLTSVTIPNSVNSIGEYAFSWCVELTSITIPNGVKSICKGAFNSCTVLTNVTVPNSITSIGERAFSWCNNLNSINYKGTKQEWDKINKDYKWKEQSYLTHINCTDGVITL